MPQLQAAESRKKKRQLPASVKLGIEAQKEKRKIYKDYSRMPPISVQAALCAAPRLLASDQNECCRPRDSTEGDAPKPELVAAAIELCEKP